MIIGLTGYLGSGKDTVAEHLIKQGFKHLSLSDILREELRSRGLEVTRKNLQEIGNDLRTRFGTGYLAQRALMMTNEGEDWIISSIGTTGEVEALQKHPQFTLVFVDAPQRQRYQRLVKRDREKESKTFKEFKKNETMENTGGGAHYRNFEATKKMANIIINNDGTIAQLHKKVDKALASIKNKRPSWDEYFLGIMQAVRERGTCDRGKTGCIIVKDNRILTTGYVGSPMGLPHCDEVGHLIHSVLNEDGTVSQHCVRTVHAEQNAIAQAARYGIRIDGATMYCYMEPCFVCAKIIINAGIKRVVAAKAYHRAKLSREFLKQAGVELDVLDNNTEQYKSR